MKTLLKLSFALLVSVSLFACTKSSTEPEPTTPNPTPGAITNTTIFYADTFRVYSTAFGGGNRKLVVDEDIKSGNNYITHISTMPGKGVVVYGYTTGYLDPTVIKTVKADGTDKKTIKTLPVGTQLAYLEGMIDNKIYYSTNTMVGTVSTVKKFVMDADGTNDKELTGLPNTFFIPNTQISNQGLGILIEGGYFAKIKNGVFDEQNSFNVLGNETKADIFRMAISEDATKVAFLYKTSAANKFEIRVKDLNKTAAVAKATTIYTVTIDADTSPYKVDILWANGAKNIIFYNGKFTMPKGAAADFTKCELIDVEKGTATNWKFTGDEIGYIVVD